jgi:hypothetical protein
MTILGVYLLTETGKKNSTEDTPKAPGLRT